MKNDVICQARNRVGWQWRGLVLESTLAAHFGAARLSFLPCSIALNAPEDRFATSALSKSEMYNHPPLQASALQDAASTQS